MPTWRSPVETFRLLLHPPAAGAWNMAVDEAILEAVAAGAVPPTLRLYAWTPPCLSLGQAQSIAEVDRERLQRLGWDLVRRPTGGRAVLHTDELTYAIVLPADHPLAEGGVLDSYRRLAEGLVEALRRLGLQPEVNPEPGSPMQGKAVCFEEPSRYEITVGGRKLLGSAQVRRQRAILQHGSLPLWGDIGRIAQALRYPDEAAREQAAAEVRRRATTVSAALECPVTWAEAARAFREAFAQRFHLRWQYGTLTEGEYQRAVALLREKHAHPDWLERK